MNCPYIGDVGEPLRTCLPVGREVALPQTYSNIPLTL
jgi:hypothetical protein